MNVWKAAFSPDHPRIRGEHYREIGFETIDIGSSPHTRGAQVEARHMLVERRIIPAYAGSTSTCVQPRIPRKDHPRIRGEHTKCTLRSSLRTGSSPHTRGARIRRPSRRKAPLDHPRIRGEHQHDVETSSSHTGSSPHTRGAPGRRGLAGRRRWIIPAYAGSTGLCNLGPEAEPDHPRIRGEHRGVKQYASKKAGSSPHTRGALSTASFCGVLARIIPAYAGSTKDQHTQAMIMFGSSPHTRGARRSRVRISWAAGIIPAYAGSTGSARSGPEN